MIAFLWSVLIPVILILLPFPTECRLPSTSNNASPSQTTLSKETKELAEQLEASLLKMFGLKTRPKPAKNVVVPQYIMDLYNKENKDPYDLSPHFSVKGKGLSSANTVRSFYHDVDSSCNGESCIRLWFNTSSLPDEELLTAAELRVYQDATYDETLMGSSTDSKKQYVHKIEVYEIMRPTKKSSDCISRLIDVRTFDIRNSSWESFDVHPAVLKWKKTPRLNHGLEIRVKSAFSKYKLHTSNHVRLRRSASAEEQSWQRDRPLLVVYSDDGRSPRTRRSYRKRRPRKKNRRDQCKRRELYVDFSDVGWTDWIVAPPGYNAFYCQGDCPFPLPSHLNATNHAIVQTLVHSTNPSAIPKACCVPTELSPISLLYLDEYGKVILRNYQDMIVEACGCR